MRSAPHHYGGHYGNYAAGHLAAAIQGFTYVEWDEATTDGLDTSAYALQDGWVTLPAAPGFGLALDEAVFGRAIEWMGSGEGQCRAQCVSLRTSRALHIERSEHLWLT